MSIIFKECTIFNRKTAFHEKDCFLALCVGFQIEIFIAKIVFRNFLRNLSKIIDKLYLNVYNEIKETNLRGGARHKNQLQKAMDIAD